MIVEVRSVSEDLSLSTGSGQMKKGVLRTMNVKRTLASTLALVLMTNVGAPAVLAARADEEDDFIAGLIIAAYLDELEKESKKASRKKSSSKKTTTKKSSSSKSSSNKKSSSSSSSSAVSYSVYEVNPYPATVRTNGDSLNMRERATSDSDVIKGLPNGSSITVTANTSNGWLRVTSGNSTGFVHSRYVAADLTAAQPAATQQQPASAAQPAEAPEANEALYYVIANPINNFVNMRAGADTSTKVIGVYYYGTALKVIGVEGDWTKVEDEANGKVGYIKSNQLQRTDADTEEDHG